MRRLIRPPVWGVPAGMNRRHFMQHLAGASAMTGAAMALGHSLRAHARQLQEGRKRCILLWMGGGPSTIDLWDLKPGAATAGPFRPISTNADVQICEHLPMMAQRMHQVSVVRSMSTREADHDRGRYYMQTGFVPNPTVEHPGYGAVVARELSGDRPDLQLPPFVAVGGASQGPGFLGMAWAPLNVSSNGRIRDLESRIELPRLANRMAMLDLIESNFVSQRRGEAAEDHRKVVRQTLEVMTSQQLAAFEVGREPEAVRERYGQGGFGEGCLLARRLVEAGVPFVEVDLGGWDNHQGIFPTLQNDRLPTLDRAMSALLEDLEQRGLWDDTIVLWMGEFGRTPRINGDAGRDHWARAWSVVIGGGGLPGGRVVGATSEDGSSVVTEPYAAEDLMATVCHALGVSLETTYTTASGRPMRIANGGKLISDLFV